MQEIGFTHMRVLDGLDTLLQLTGLVAKLCVNGAKHSIDELKRLLEGRKASKLGQPPSDVIDEEEFAMLTKLKASKARYRSAFDSLSEVRNDVEYISGVVEQCRTQLLADFEAWMQVEHPEAAGHAALAAVSGGDLSRPRAEPLGGSAYGGAPP